MGDPVFVRMLIRELVAYPLYAFCGVGLGVLIRNWLFPRAWSLIVLVVPLWMVGTLGLGDQPHRPLPQLGRVPHGTNDSILPNR